MTNRQFAALAARLDKAQLRGELIKILQVNPPRVAALHQEDEVRKWATNGWNTERILRLTADLLPSDQLENALQWAFPQAYYSVFALTLALYKTTGQTETSHAGVLRSFGDRVASGRYPACLSFTATGVEPIAFEGTAKASAVSSLTFDPRIPETVNTQIAQFLKGTREKDLKEQKRKMLKSFMTKNGGRKKNLTEEDWGKVSESLGRTSILSLLYRKRIKSNYGDIDTFLNPNIIAAPLLKNLIHVVNCVNFTHEVCIARAVGLAAYRQLQAQLSRTPEFLQSRTVELVEILDAATKSPASIP